MRCVCLSDGGPTMTSSHCVQPSRLANCLCAYMENNEAHNYTIMCTVARSMDVCVGKDNYACLTKIKD